jgi:IPT/TIG domain-containing protein
MATVGNTGTPNQTFAFYGFNGSNLLAIKITMPQSGLITAVTCYMAGHGQTINPRMCVWNASGTLVAESNALTVGAGSGSTGGQSFHTGTLTSSYVAHSGEVLYIGFWRPANQSDEWTEQNGGTEYQKTDSSNSTVPNVPSWNTTSGQPAFYATYTPYSVPSVSSFSPNAGPAGTSVTITGSGFTGTTSVKFNGTSASFTVNSDSSITATAPGGATNGHISVTNPAGTGTSSASYIFSSIYGDSGSTFQPCAVYADNGSAWQQAQVWVDDGTTWHQVA